MPTNDLNPLADATAARLRAWLLGGAVQQRDGEHAGGIYGAFDDDGAARYVYPEITGYYLHWLADISSPHDTGHPLIVRRAQAAADWATRALAGGKVPATRAYLGAEAEADWRNRAVFFFDLAMLLRGLCAAYEADLIAYPQTAIARLIEELTRFVDASGRIQAARSELADAALPPRWSTLGGPFEVKASSRVLLAARHQPLPVALEQACRALAQSYRGSAATLPLQMLHPTLYFAEGMLVGEPDCAAQIAMLAKRCLDLADAAGNLPEAEDSTVPRSDIIAQLLRVLLLTDSLDARADALVGALAARVDSQGRLPFRSDIAAPQANVWCAMFAEQSLRWYAGRARGLPAAEWLV